MLKKIIYSRWSLLIEAGISAFLLLTFIISHFVFIKIDWSRYETDGSYYLKVQQILQTGLFRIAGNVRSVQSVWLILLLILSSVIALLIFLLHVRQYYERSFLPLFSATLYLLPLILGHQGNMILLFVMSYFLVFLSAIFYRAGL